MKNDKSLLDYLGDDQPESTRVQAVAAFVYKAEQDIRALELQVAGLFLKCQDEEMSKNVRAVQRAAEDKAIWYAANHDAFLARMTQPKKAQPKQEPKDSVREPTVH